MANRACSPRVPFHHHQRRWLLLMCVCVSEWRRLFFCCCCCVDFGIFRPNVFSSSFCFLLLMDNRQEFIFGDPLRGGLRWRRKHTHNRTKMRDGDRCSLRVCLARKRERAQLGPFSFLFFKKKTHTKNKTFSIPHSPRTGYWINKRERRKGGLSLYFRKKKKKKIFI